MARFEKGPFVPDMEACRLVVEADGATCRVMDDCCRDEAAADRVRQEIQRIAAAAALRREAGDAP